MSQNEATTEPQPEQPVDPNLETVPPVAGQPTGGELSANELETVAGGIIGTNGQPVLRPVKNIERPESTLLKGGGG